MPRTKTIDAMVFDNSIDQSFSSYLLNFIFQSLAMYNKERNYIIIHLCLGYIHILIGLKY